ncbi:unnamed protein product [Rhizopus stolonifer]
MTAQRYDFKAPMNMNAIRSSIIQRIKQRNVEKTCLDNGLPSPPIEAYENKLPTEQVMTALIKLSDDKPKEMDKDLILERIRSLQEEKHKLFQMMRGLLHSKQRIHSEYNRPISRYNHYTINSTQSKKY